MKHRRHRRLKWAHYFFCFTPLKPSSTVLLTPKLHSCLEAHYFTLPKTKPSTSNSSNTQPDIFQPSIIILKGFCCHACLKYWALEQLSCLIAWLQYDMNSKIKHSNHQRYLNSLSLGGVLMCTPEGPVLALLLSGTSLSSYPVIPCGEELGKGSPQLPGSFKPKIENASKQYSTRKYSREDLAIGKIILIKSLFFLP